MRPAEVGKVFHGRERRRARLRSRPRKIMLVNQDIAVHIGLVGIKGSGDDVPQAGQSHLAVIQRIGAVQVVPVVHGGVDEVVGIRRNLLDAEAAERLNKCADGRNRPGAQNHDGERGQILELPNGENVDQVQGEADDKAFGPQQEDQRQVQRGQRQGAKGRAGVGRGQEHRDG